MISFVLSAQTPAPKKSGPAKKSDAATQDSSNAQSSSDQDEGDRLFQTHCSRCHNAPEGFSPRISGTIVRHMRIRASLSQHEEEAILRFFNP
jgi:cytochrome c5